MKIFGLQIEKNGVIKNSFLNFCLQIEKNGIIKNSFFKLKGYINNVNDF